DYKNAISLLPSSWDSANRGRMTKWAANAALGRLLMFMNQPAEARPYLEAVIGSGLYQMAANYEGIFSDAYDNDPQNDRLWEVQYVGGQSTEGQDYS
ncbi:RagB/SusD family nutrient uptake outer membrane protein, partial [Bacillus pumilus]